MEQMRKPTFNADGLQLVFIGLLLNLVSGAFSGLGVNNQVEGLKVISNLGGMGLSIASIVLMIVGLSKMVKYSKRFDIARKFYIAELILAVAGAIVLGILMAVAFVSLQSYTAQASTVTVLFVLFFVVFFGWLVAMVIIALKSMKYLLHGCAELADAVKERELAGKLRGIYTLYLISVLVFFGVVILFMILVISSISTNLSLYMNPSFESLMMGMGGLAVVGVVLLLGASIFMLVVNILIVVKVYQAKTVIHGQPIPGGANARTATMAPGAIPTPTAGQPNVTPSQPTMAMPQQPTAAPAEKPAEEVKETETKTDEQPKDQQ